MHTVDVEGSVPTAASYLEFTEGQNTAFTFLTTGSDTGSFNMFNDSCFKSGSSISICSAEYYHY